MNNEIPEGAPARGRQTPRNYVPTGFNTDDVMGLFLRYAESKATNGGEKTRQGFITWQGIDPVNPILNGNTASANCTPLARREFSMYDRRLEEIQAICKGGIDGLIVAVGPRRFTPGRRVLVSLIDSYLVGKMSESGLESQFLTDSGFAGTPNAAGTLRTVGSQVGIFFGLLDNHNNYTETSRCIFNWLGINDDSLGL